MQPAPAASKLTIFMPPTPGDLLIFLHIPKAGGTTLRELMQGQFPPDQYLDLRNDRDIADDLAALAPVVCDRLRGLAGHVTYGVHEAFAQPSTYFTFLRHPVARMMSHYAYVRGNPRHFLYEVVVGDNLSLLEYVSSDLSEELANDQTRRIAGVGTGADPTSEDLATAKRHLASHFCVTGVTERFDESLLLLSQGRDWRRPYYLARNVGDSPMQALSSAEQAAIVARNGLDLQLYDFARQRLDEAIAARGPQFATDLARYRHRNRQYQRLRGSAEGLMQPVRDMRARLVALSGSGALPPRLDNGSA